MCNCKNLIKATSVAITTPTGGGESYITITVPSTVSFTAPGCYRIALYTTIPTTLNCARIVITNGTDTLDVLKRDGNYWRPCQLKCRDILKLQYLDDPAHLLRR